MYDISHIDVMEGHEFEQFIASLLRKLGYKNVEVTRGSGDQGVDVLAEKDDVRYAIQCKCYSSDLGNTPVQEVNTGKVIYHCHVGVVVTNRYFTQGAKDAAKATGVLLWDRAKLTALIAQAGMEISMEIPAQRKGETLTLWSGNPLLRRGGISLKDKDWKKARQFFDRVLNTEPENAEAYLGLVMAEAELSDKYEFSLAYIYNPMKFRQLNQNNLRHAKEFANEGLKTWFIELETQKKDAEETDKNLTSVQARNEEYKQVILTYLFETPGLVVTAADIVEKLLQPTYPNELWSAIKAASLLNSMSDKYNMDGELISKGKLIRVENKDSKTTFTLSEAERYRRLEQIEAERRRQEERAEAERRQLEQAEAERRRQEEKRAEERAALESEQTALQTELASLKGLFTGKRRREIEARQKEIEKELRGYDYEQR